MSEALRDKEELKAAIIEAMKSVYDPEIPVDIYELGLIYEVNIDDARNVEIIMTLTSPSCPVAGSLPQEVEDKAAGVQGATEACVELVFEPPWNQEMMSEEAMLELGFL
ncbi:MAG: SUF system Fe-S cluster assembly protein [Chitinophagales bacterium]|nr:SUF system Fe-S cluster assembly protein [Chitinophagales bacterium]MDC3209557.1 SUF system Fe-S cluster assembly protein [Chitinophagales bacterium]|tara:strand:+ start:1010 stop:1336 length:327 start_codon:yes stop_codon:yes gene_type:complete